MLSRYTLSIEIILTQSQTYYNFQAVKAEGRVVKKYNFFVKLIKCHLNSVIQYSVKEQILALLRINQSFQLFLLDSCSAEITKMINNFKEAYQTYAQAET